MNEDYGAGYASLYARHWWWRSRESMVVDLIRRLDLPKPAVVMDVGCGDAVTFPALSQFGPVEGIEIDRSLVSSGNPHTERIHHEPLGHAVYSGRKFGLITALDVIEHIEDDAQAVADMVEMLLPGGVLVVTVPAFMSLWDSHDVINHHFRRYTAKQLRARLAPHGKVLRVGYLFHSLYFLKRAVKAINVFRPGAVTQHALPSGFVNRIMERFCLAEYGVCRRLSVPFGSSVVGVLQRRR
jgi:trans-aconitate methyltransferase